MQSIQANIKVNMGASEPKLEPVTTEEDFQILEPGQEFPGPQTSQPQANEEPLPEQMNPSEDPVDTSIPNHDVSAKCECQNCTLLEQLLKQYEAHNHERPQIPHLIRDSAPNTIKITLPSPSALVDKAKSSWRRWSERTKESVANQKQRLTEVAQKLRDKMPEVKVPKKVVKGLAGILILTILAFAGYGVYEMCSPPRIIHYTSNCANENLQIMVQELQQQNIWLNHQIQEKSSLVSTFNFQLVKAREQIENLKTTLAQSRELAQNNERLLKIAGLSTAELNNQLDVTVNGCVLQNFNFQFLGQEYTGQYQGQCVGQTAHGHGKIFTPEGREFQGSFRGGRMHGKILVIVGDRVDQYQFVHGVENGFYHTQGYHNTQVLGCRLDGAKIGPQLHVDTTGKQIYSVQGHQIPENAPTITVADDAKSVFIQGMTNLRPGEQITFVLPSLNIKQPVHPTPEPVRNTVNTPKCPHAHHRGPHKHRKDCLLGKFKHFSKKLADQLDGRWAQDWIVDL